MVQPRVYGLIAVELASRLLQRNSLIRAPNPRPRVFFISSKESLPVAKALRHGLRYTEADSPIWSDEDLFPPGSYPLEVLEYEVDKADFGVAIAHPDDIVRSRRNESAAPRDNVILSWASSCRDSDESASFRMSSSMKRSEFGSASRARITSRWASKMSFTYFRNTKPGTET